MKLDTDHIDNDNVPALLERGLAALRAGDTVVDLTGVVHCDSAAVALLLAWRRAAQAEGRDLQLVGVPSSLCNLASLYGVDGLLPGVTPRGAVQPVATPG